MNINQIFCHFWSHEPVFNFYLSLSWHIIPPKLSSWNITLWIKRAHQSTSFQIFECFLKFHPIPHASFETTRSRFIQILHHCSVSWNITPLYSFTSNLYTLDKKIRRSDIFKLLNSLYFLCHVWNCEQFFFKICIPLQFHER